MASAARINFSDTAYGINRAEAKFHSKILKTGCQSEKQKENSERNQDRGIDRAFLSFPDFL
jgi:hypothetical protein